MARPGTALTAEDVIAHTAERLARFKQPKRMVTIDEMPRNATLKIDRALLKKIYGAAPAV